MSCLELAYCSPGTNWLVHMEEEASTIDGNASLTLEHERIRRTTHQRKAQLQFENTPTMGKIKTFT